MKILVLLLLFMINGALVAGENVLLLAGGYEGNDRHFLFDTTAAEMAQTLTARGWRAQSVYGEAGHSERHRERLAAAGISKHVPYSLEALRASIKALLKGDAPDQVVLHLGGHGTIVDGRFRLQTGAETFLHADEIASLISPLLARGVDVAITVDSCSSGQLIDNLSSVLGDQAQHLCTITSTNTRPYVSNRGILGHMMDQLASRREAVSMEDLFRQVRLNDHFVRPRENLFPQISSFPTGMGLSNSSTTTGQLSGVRCESGNIPVVASPGSAGVDIVTRQLRELQGHVERTCTPELSGQYSNECRDSLPDDSYQNNIIVTPQQYPSLYEWRDGQVSGARSGVFELNVRYFPDFDASSGILRTSPAGICLSLLDARVNMSRDERSRLQNLIGERFFNRCQRALEQRCCHYNFQRFVDLERQLYNTTFNARHNACQRFQL